MVSTINRESFFPNEIQLHTVTKTILFLYDEDMHLFKTKSLTTMCLGISLAAYAVSMLLVKVDTTFTYRWFAFGLYMAALLSIAALYLTRHIKHKQLTKDVIAKEIDPALALFILALLVNMLFLSTYPYVSISDELRDGGTFAIQIASGVLKNIWGYGAYGGYGLLTPILTSFLYYLFGSSVLTYRLPAALAASFAVLFTYILVRRLQNKTTAVWAALILTAMPLHIFFAHTEAVVALNAFFTPLILLLLYQLLHKRSALQYIYLGTVLGLTGNFHATIKAFACVIFLIVLFLDVKNLMQHFSLKEIKKWGIHTVLLLVFALVGFGPLLLHTGSQEFFHSNRFTFEDQVTEHKHVTTQDLSTMKANYVKSLMVYVYETTSFHYHDPKPLLPPFLAIFFVLGVGFSFFVLKDTFINILLFLLLAIPFTNSTLTDAINADHRLPPLFVLVAIMTAIGISYVAAHMKWKGWRYLFWLILACYLATQTITFYTSNAANKDIGMQDTIAISALYSLQHDPQFHVSPLQNLSYVNGSSPLTSVCFYVSPTNYAYYNGNIRVQEPQAYFTPRADIQYQQEDAISDNELYMVRRPCDPAASYRDLAPHQSVITCSSFSPYICPVGKTDEIVIHY